MIVLKEEIDTIVTKSNNNVNAIKEICDTFTEQENELLSKDGSDYTIDWNKDVIKSFVLYVNDIPVSFCDLWNSTDDIASIAVGTKNSRQYRGHGYAQKVAEVAINWAINNLNKTNIDWFVNKDNVSSIKIAKNLGFEYLGKSEVNNNWIFYTMEI